ncbi:MAG: hypothetical protein WB523_02390 [Candidatus Sulfotelmatobacter sp.]
MPRKCSVCMHASKAEIDKRIVAGGESALTLARLFDLSDDAILRHKSHLTAAIRNAQVIKSTGFQELTTGIERLILKVEKHLSNTAKSEVWFKESRELRNWVALRAKLAGKVVVGESEGRRQGDTYNIVFRGPDGEPLKIPLKVYERLPAELFAESESASAYQPNAPVTSAEDQAVTG